MLPGRPIDWFLKAHEAVREAAAVGDELRGLEQRLSIARSDLGRKVRSVTTGRPTASGMARMCCWIAGARRRRPRICVIRARVSPSRRAISAWLASSPASSNARHPMAFRSSSTTRAGLPCLGGLRPRRACGPAPAGGSASARRVRVLKLPLLNPLRAQSHVHDLFAVGGRIGPVLQTYVHDAKIDLRFRDAGPVSRPTHPGSLSYFCELGFVSKLLFRGKWCLWQNSSC